MYNPSDKPVQLCHKNTLGILTPTEGLTDAPLEALPWNLKKVKEVKTQNQSSQKSPERVQAPMDEAKVVITPQQTQDFQQLLINNCDVFPLKTEPLDSQMLSNMAYNP